MPRILGALLLACLLFKPVMLHAADTEPDQVSAQIEAAYIFKFAEHIGWPDSSFASNNAPLTIGVMDADLVLAELNRLKQTYPINGRPVLVRALRPGDAATGLQLLFVGGHDMARLRRQIESLQAQPVLVITDGDGTLAAGSTISFILVDNRIRFDISTVHAERCGLKVSARLLAVAHAIDSGR